MAFVSIECAASPRFDPARGEENGNQFLHAPDKMALLTENPAKSLKIPEKNKKNIPPRPNHQTK